MGHSMCKNITHALRVKQCQFTVEGGGWVEQGSSRIENKEDDLVYNRLKVKYGEWLTLGVSGGKLLYHMHNVTPLMVLLIRVP